MKKLNTLKTLPLIGLLALGVAMVPAVSQAAPGALGSALSHDGGKGHHRDGGKSPRDHGKQYRDKGHYDRGHGHKGYAKGHDKGHKRVYNYGKGHGYEHYGHVHRVYRPHTHVEHVVVHDHYDHDPLRLLLGLHFDNIDIIYRDY